MLKPAELHLSQEWDKTFPQSDRVDHRKVTFLNRYGLTLAADLYTPKGAQGRLPGLHRLCRRAGHSVMEQGGTRQGAPFCYRAGPYFSSHRARRRSSSSGSRRGLS